MGKVRKVRQKYHLSHKKSKSTSNLTEEKPPEEPISKDNFLLKSNDNIFAGIDISWDDLTKSLPKDFDVRSIVTTKSRKELKEEERHLKKKERQKLRHERFMQKLDVAQQLMKSLKSKNKKKKNKNIGGDMTSLLSALPSLEALEDNRHNKKYEKPKLKPKGILKAKERIKQQSVDAKIFKQILDDKNFKANPLQAVTQYLKQKVAMET